MFLDWGYKRAPITIAPASPLTEGVERYTGKGGAAEPCDWLV